MPYNHRKMELSLEACDKKLAALFPGNEKNPILGQKIKSIQNYYNMSYNRASTEKTILSITKSYELLIEQLTQIKKGRLTPPEVLKEIENTIQFRKMHIVFHDLIKICEATFWGATAFSLFAGIFGIALPLLIIQPILGIPVSITIIGSLLATGAKCLSCLGELKTFSRHNAEYKQETSLISFFKPTYYTPEITCNIEGKALV